MNKEEHELFLRMMQVFMASSNGSVSLDANVMKALEKSAFVIMKARNSKEIFKDKPDIAAVVLEGIGRDGIDLYMQWSENETK